MIKFQNILIYSHLFYVDILIDSTKVKFMVEWLKIELRHNVFMHWNEMNGNFSIINVFA